MNTMEITKIVGGLCGALLVLLLVKWGAEELYHVGPKGHGDGEEHAAGYAIEVEVASAETTSDTEELIETLLATADVEKGKKVFSKCRACHKLEDGQNGTGPHLFNVIDRPIGQVAGYAYSAAMASKGGAWDYTAMNEFLLKPSSNVPGTKMSFAGLKKATDRANLIAYLDTIK